MKGILPLIVIVISGVAFAQNADQKPENQGKIKEVPSATHGKTVSELAKETPGGPEKGKIISSAARQQGIEKREGRVNSGNSSQNKGNKPTHAGTGKGGNKPAAAPRAVPPAKPRPGGPNGG
jgi:hypothetical protein